MPIKWMVLSVFAFLQLQIYAQLTLDDVKMDNIRQKTVRKYIETQRAANIHQFSDIHPSVQKGDDLSSYRKIEMKFELPGKLQDIWNGYLSADPSKSWNGRKVSFGVLIQKSEPGIFYNSDLMPVTAIGQVYYLNLKVLMGIYNLPVAFEFIAIDPKEKIIEFSYLQGNKSTGVQQIKFMATDSLHTKITHTSYYKSNSPARDKWIYPYFHKKIINDFHHNMMVLLSLKKTETAKSNN